MQTNVELIDKNFAVKATHKSKGIDYFSFRIFSLHGVFYDESESAFLRMDKSVASKISGGLAFLNGCTAGGRIRLRTNSRIFRIKVQMGRIFGTPFQSVRQGVAFSLYADGRFYKLLMPDSSVRIAEGEWFESECAFDTEKCRDITLYFPSYGFIKDLQIGLSGGSRVLVPKPYNGKSVVFYGSSITQGSCASRPGNDYCSMLSQMLGFDYLNLGFSGNAKAEDIMCDYIAGIDSSVFVYDYDYNAETVEELKARHEPFYLRLRERRPDLPIILLPKPNNEPNPEIFAQRKAVIRQTYDNALRRGDKNVYFVDYNSLYKGKLANAHTVDGCHPNDFGFYLMAKEICPCLKKILQG